MSEHTSRPALHREIDRAIIRLEELRENAYRLLEARPFTALRTAYGFALLVKATLDGNAQVSRTGGATMQALRAPHRSRYGL